MKCPFCRQSTTEVYNTRVTKSGSQIWRRRRCLSCHQTFTSYEAPDLSFLKVIAPGQAKPSRYSRARLFSAIYSAFAGLTADDDTIDAVTDTVEAKLLDLQHPQVTTTDIARLILTTLKHFHTAAFLRYLAAHTELSGPAELKKALKKY